MATDDSFLLRQRSKSSLLPDSIRPAARAPDEEKPESHQPEATGDDLPVLPLPGSVYDAAYSRPGNKPMPTLRLIIGDTIRGLHYSNLDTIDLVAGEKPGTGPAIVMQFTGVVPREAKITGRHLMKLYDMLSTHRISWVRQLPDARDFKSTSETVVTGITVERMKKAPE
jgi:hypothetical protein